MEETETEKTYPESYVRTLRQENAQYRVQRNKARQRVEELGVEIQDLRSSAERLGNEDDYACSVL